MTRTDRVFLCEMFNMVMLMLFAISTGNKQSRIDEIARDWKDLMLKMQWWAKDDPIGR